MEINRCSAGIRRYLVAILFAVTGLVQANPPSTVIDTVPGTNSRLTITTESQTFVGADGNPVELTLQVTAGTATTEKELGAINRFVQSVVDSAAIEGRQTPFQRVVVDAPGGAGVDEPPPLAISLPVTQRETLPAHWLKSLKEKFWNWYSKPRVYRASFALIQFLMSGGVTYKSTLIEGRDVTQAQALAMGFILGAIHAGLMYNNQGWYDFIFKSPSLARALGRSYVANAAIAAVALSSMAVLNIFPYETALAAAGSFVLTSLADVALEFPWEATIKELSDRAKSKDPKSGALVDFHNYMSTCFLGAIAAGATMAQLMNVPLAHTATVGLAAAGGATYYAILKWGAKPARELPVCAVQIATKE